MNDIGTKYPKSFRNNYYVGTKYPNDKGSEWWLVNSYAYIIGGISIPRFGGLSNPHVILMDE